MNRFDDPEMSYRRGYEHGAWDLFKTIEHLLPASARQDAKNWIQHDIRNWRADNLAGRTGRRDGAMGPTLDIAPPPISLSVSEITEG